MQLAGNWQSYRESGLGTGREQSKQLETVARLENKLEQAQSD